MEPSALTANTNVIWNETVSFDPGDGRTIGSPVDGWTLKYRFRGPANYTIVAGPNGASHTVTLAAAVTNTYAPGDYWWFSYVEKGAERFDYKSGRITIKADPVAATAAFDGRTNAQKMITAIEAMMQGTASREEQSYTINAPGGGGRSLSFFPREDLIKFLQFFQRAREAEVAAENAAAGRGTGRRILTRFTRS